MCASARTVNGSEQLSYWCPGILIFLECSSMLNAASVTNAFLSHTWLSKCFFFLSFLCFSFYMLTYIFILKVIMKRNSFCGRYGDKKALKETEICGVIASKWILFIQRLFMFRQKMNWVSYLPFPFHIMNHKKIKFLKTFWNLVNNFAIEMY